MEVQENLNILNNMLEGAGIKEFTWIKTGITRKIIWKPDA